MLRKVFYGLICLLLLSGCSKGSRDNDVVSIYQDTPEPELYQKAMAAFKEGDYSSAIKRFEAFDTLYPFSAQAKPAQLYLINAYYENGNYGMSAAAAQSYVHMYPRDNNVDYAYYMKGVANFEQPRGTFAKVFKVDSAWRDPGTQLTAYHDFETFTKRFPRSRYYSDSLKRMIFLRNQFAQKELHVAKYYLDRKRYVAALERANYVIKHYSQASQAKKALQLSAKINRILKFNQSAVDARKVIKDTYA